MDEIPSSRTELFTEQIKRVVAAERDVADEDGPPSEVAIQHAADFLASIPELEPWAQFGPGGFGSIAIWLRFEGAIIYADFLADGRVRAHAKEGARSATIAPQLYADAKGRLLELAFEFLIMRGIMSATEQSSPSWLTQAESGALAGIN